MRETNGKFGSCNSCKRLFPAVYMSYMSQNFRLFLASNLSFLNFRTFPLMYPGSVMIAEVGQASDLPKTG